MSVEKPAPTPEQCAAMSDPELVELADHFVGTLSYYAAAEGPSWYQEADARRDAERRAKPVRAEMQRRGLKVSRPGLVRMD